VASLDETATRLKAVIRNTLLGDANQMSTVEDGSEPMPVVLDFVQPCVALGRLRSRPLDLPWARRLISDDGETEAHG
jgi:hypothetical protein